MDYDVLQNFQKRCPEYILPDDPPDSKPDLNILKKMKDEPNHSPCSSSSASSDDPPDSKPDLYILKKIKDESDHLTYRSSTSPDNLQRDPFEAMEEEPTAGPSGSAAAPGLERVKLDVSEAEAEEAVRRDDELGLVETALGRTLRPVLRRCDEVLSRPDGVQVSAITAGQRRRLGRVDTMPCAEIVTDFVKLEVVKHELEDDPAWTISETQDNNYMSTNKSRKTGGKPAGKCIKECPGDRVPRLRTARRTSISGVKTRLRAAGDIRTSCHGQQDKSKSDALPGGPTPPAQRTVSAEGDTPRGRGRQTLSNPTSGGAMIRCVHCEYECLQQDHLDSHVKRSHGHIGKDGRHKCEWCDYSTDHTGGLKNHRLTHTGERPHRCDDCGKTFTTLSQLTCHCRIHSGQRPYSCDVCGKAFTQVGHLTSHKRIHSGMKVRQCDQCGATFTDASHYTRHMMSHNGVKAHRCQVCPARFIRRSGLTTHMATHTGERPYSCSFCAARFSEQTTMKRHVTRHHTHDFRHRCSGCGKGYFLPSELKKHVDKC